MGKGALLQFVFNPFVWSFFSLLSLILFPELCFLPPFCNLFLHYFSFCIFMIWYIVSLSIVLNFTFCKPTVINSPYCCCYVLQEHMLFSFLCVSRKELLSMLSPFIYSTTWPFWSQMNCLGWLSTARGSTLSLFHFDLFALHLSLLQLMETSHSIVWTVETRGTTQQSDAAQ